MAAKTHDTAVLEQIAASLEELVSINKNVLKELWDAARKTPGIKSSR